MTIDFKERRTTDRVVHCSPVSPRFFSTLGARLIAGRDFDERVAIDVDGTVRQYRSAIVNARFARRYFGDASPIGHRLALGARPDATTNIEIVGVVAGFSYRGIREETEQAFFPFLDLPWSGGTLYVRTQGKPESSFAAIRATVASVDSALPILSLRTIEDQIDRSLTTERMMATLLTGFGAIALLLSVIGLYGVMSFVVTQRTREIGIRLALGATGATAVWLVVRDALLMVVTGTTIASGRVGPREGDLGAALRRRADRRADDRAGDDSPRCCRSRRDDGAGLARLVGQPDGGAARRVTALLVEERRGRTQPLLVVLPRSLHNPYNVSYFPVMTDWLGEFEQLVLFAVLHLDEAYGVSIRQEIERRTGRSVSAGAVYTTLERLEARGLVASTWGEPTPERGGKRKRYYMVRPAGRQSLARSWHAMRAMARGIAPKLSER
jgi:DNA-binding PadR family transcriptional regulator